MTTEFILVLVTLKAFGELLRMSRKLPPRVLEK